MDHVEDADNLEESLNGDIFNLRLELRIYSRRNGWIGSIHLSLPIPERIRHREAG